MGWSSRVEIKGLTGTPFAELAEGFGGRLTHLHGLVGEGDDQGLHGSRVADLTERSGGGQTLVLFLVVQGAGERSHGMSADLDKRRGCSLAHPPGVVLDDGDEG